LQILIQKLNIEWQDFYKTQGAPAAAFQGSYGFNYPAAPMSVPYDSMNAYQGGQQQGSQGKKAIMDSSCLEFSIFCCAAAYAGRGSTLGTGANGTGAAVVSHEYMKYMRPSH
jgi:hypothetical protein